MAKEGKPESGLSIPSFGGVGRSQQDFDKLMMDLDQLNWITLTQGSSEIVKKKIVGVGEFVYGMDNDKLGDDFIALVGPWRPIATLLIDGDFVKESYRPETDHYKEIERLAKDKSQPKSVAASYGVQFLLWLPVQGIFGTYAFTKTARRRSPKVLALMGKLVKISAELIEGSEYSWYVPHTEEYTPTEKDKEFVDQFIFPDEAVMQNLSEKFATAPDRLPEEGTERVEESEDGNAGRER